MNTVRLGIIGLGNIGSSHIKLFLENKIPGATLTAVCDINPAALERHPKIKGWTDSMSLIRSGEVDAVLIATPHYQHVPIGIDALENGLHVLCEKPLAVHKADCQRLLAAHTDPGLVFGVMFDTRTEPRYQKVREMVLGGELGHIRRINWTMTNWFRSNAYYASSSWRATWAGEGGGILVNQLPHDLDLFQWIFGLPKRVRSLCSIGKYHPIEVEDEVHALLEMTNGATAVLVGSTGEAPGTDRREIVGDKGRLVIHKNHLELSRNMVAADEFCHASTDGFATPPSEVVHIPIQGKAGRHAEVICRFVDAIREGKPLIAKAEEGLASAELANAILLASVEDRTVDLPLDPTIFTSRLKQLCASSRVNPAEAFSTSGPVADMSASFN